MSYVKPKEDPIIPEPLLDKPGDSEEKKAEKANARQQVRTMEFTLTANKFQFHAGLPKSIHID